MSRKNLVFRLNAKMLLASQIARILNFHVSKTRWAWSECPGMPKKAIKSLRSQKLKKGKG